MRATQKLKINIEGLCNIVEFRNVDVKILPLVVKLEKEGDLFGPVAGVVFNNVSLCVAVSYADERRGPTKQTIFGYDAAEFMAKQYKD